MRLALDRLTFFFIQFISSQVATGVAGSEANLLILPIKDNVIYFHSTRGLIAKDYLPMLRRSSVY